MGQKPIESVFKLNWTKEIGFTTYRNNMFESNGKIFVGSNGDFRHIGNDKNDGVFILDLATGKSVTQIKTKPSIDNDVCGIAMANNTLVFGNDNGQVFSYNITQINNPKLNWSYQLQMDSTFSDYDQKYTYKGHLESCPVLTDVNNDKINDVIICQESYGIYALNGLNGKVLWSNIFERGSSYYSSPAIYDLNNDNVSDIIYAGEREYAGYDYGSSLYALNGKNGDVLWEYKVETRIKSSPSIIDFNGKKMIMFAETYSDVNFLDLNGVMLFYANLNYSGISGLFSSPVINNKGTVVIGCAWWDNNDDGVWSFNINSKYMVNEKGIKMVNLDSRNLYGANRVSASAVCFDAFGDGKSYFLIPTEKEELIILDEMGELHSRLKLPAGAEATPLVVSQKIGNKTITYLLIACIDGNLYCYETASKGNIQVSQFRYNSQNTGNNK